jgi:hypothetical protein
MAKRKAVTKRKAVAKPKAVAKRKAALEPKTMAKRKAETDPEKRIEALKRHAEELCGGQMEVHSFHDCPEETEEAFWKHLVDYEEAPWTTKFQQLENAGVSLPAPDSLSDEELTVKLWDLIQKLALLHVFLEQTDHLSDRELYTYLWTDALREETKAMPLVAGSAWHIQLLSSGSEKDNQLYLKYYADEAWRKQWHKEWPKDHIPKHVDPPYDRDRLLPKPNYNAPTSQEPN